MVIQERFKCALISAALTHATWFKWALSSFTVCFGVWAAYLFRFVLFQCDLKYFTHGWVFEWWRWFRQWINEIRLPQSSRISFLRFIVRPHWCCIKAVLSTVRILITLQVHGWEAEAFYHQDCWMHNKYGWLFSRASEKLQTIWVQRWIVWDLFVATDVIGANSFMFSWFVGYKLRLCTGWMYWPHSNVQYWTQMFLLFTIKADVKKGYFCSSWASHVSGHDGSSRVGVKAELIGVALTEVVGTPCNLLCLLGFIKY